MFIHAKPDNKLLSGRILKKVTVKFETLNLGRRYLQAWNVLETLNLHFFNNFPIVFIFSRL